METPRLLLDRSALEANITRGQAVAEGLGLALRPHVKTHKSLHVARLQLTAGAAGLTASKADEALVFMEGFAGELPDVTCAYPLVDRVKLGRLLEAAQHTGVRLRCMADGPGTVDALADAAESAGHAPSVLLKIDVGLHRCGLAPTIDGRDNPALPALGLRVRERGLDLSGILSHAGHAYGSRDAAAALEIAREECALMARAKAALEDAGLDVPVVSVGSTPTVLALELAEDAEEWASGLTELRPGNYVFLDRAALRLGLARPGDMALTVAATVVSANHGHIICDAGSKVLSSDGGAHGSSQPGFGLAWPEDIWLEGRWGDADAGPMIVDKLSEEHGWLLPPDSGPRPAVGDRVRIVPNHACAVANLADSFTVLEPDGSTDSWPVHARGTVL